MTLIESPSLASTSAKYMKVISDKHEDPMFRFGAIGQFIDDGGRNVTITFQSFAGSANTLLAWFCFVNFGNWYPLARCACLLFSPTISFAYGLVLELLNAPLSSKAIVFQAGIIRACLLKLSNMFSRFPRSYFPQSQ
jgi:hypothetical protein